MIRADFSSICFAGVLYLFFVHHSWSAVVSSADGIVGSSAPVHCVELAGSVILVARASRGDLLTVAVTFSVGLSLATVAVLVCLVAVEDL